ncbi:MAG: radical SAM protein [Gammaproteobacteria bacterium]|nr:radical SAM protein [Gammaproteobacteria bacterium]
MLKKFMRSYFFRAYPKIIYIFLSEKCNLRCFFCREEDYKGKQKANLENIHKLKNAIKHAEIIDLTGTGEPFLCPDLKEALEYVYSLNNKENLIHLTTNGAVLSEEKAMLLRGHLGELVISLNASNSISYNLYKFGDFEDAVARIKRFMASLDDAEQGKVRLSFVAHKENFYEIPDFIRLAKKLGISVVLIRAYVIRKVEHYHYSLVHVKKEYNKIFDEAVSIGNNLNINVIGRRFFTETDADFSPENCQFLFNHCLIWYNGDVSPCCLAGTMIAGNAYEKDFEAVWFGKTYRKLRITRLPQCRNCPSFTPFDNYKAHFQPHVLESEDFNKIKELQVFE